MHYETPNPLIPWERLPFVIPRATVPLADALGEDDPNATVRACVPACLRACVPACLPAGGRAGVRACGRACGGFLTFD